MPGPLEGVFRFWQDRTSRWRISHPYCDGSLGGKGLIEVALGYLNKKKTKQNCERFDLVRFVSTCFYLFPVYSYGLFTLPDSDTDSHSD